MITFGLVFSLSCLVLGLASSSSPAGSFAPFKRGGNVESETENVSLFGSKQRNPEREQLYEAYNLLHTLAQVRGISRWLDQLKTRGYSLIRLLMLIFLYYYLFLFSCRIFTSLLIPLQSSLLDTRPAEKAPSLRP